MSDTDETREEIPSEEVGTGEADVAGRTLELLQKLSKRMDDLEATQATRSAKRTRTRHPSTESHVESGEEEQREKRVKTFSIPPQRRNSCGRLSAFPSRWRTLRGVASSPNLESPRVMKLGVLRWTRL